VQLDQEALRTDLSVIILTHNEQANLAQALDSVSGWAKQVFIVDSFSSDGTVEVATRYGCKIFQFRFEGFPEQRNRALRELPIETEWVLFLDADEWLPDELKAEITAKLREKPAANGFFLRRRLFRHGRAYCEDRSVNEHMVLEGAADFLREDFIHQDRKPVSEWIEKHNRYAVKEARELFRAQSEPAKLAARFFGAQAERTRWLRERIYNRLPPIVRPFLFFGYRVIVCGGALDGWRAVLYHFLQAFWYPLLIDVNFLEESKQERLSLSHEHSFSSR
jgi:glycosyltransferase involved in cell wall biosynthesis